MDAKLEILIKQQCSQFKSRHSDRVSILAKIFFCLDFQFYGRYYL